MHAPLTAACATLIHTGATGPEVLRRVVAATAFLPPDVRALVAATPADRVSEHGSCVHTPATMTPVG